jgi:hypothetical protein
MLGAGSLAGCSDAERPVNAASSSPVDAPGGESKRELGSASSPVASSQASASATGVASAEAVAPTWTVPRAPSDLPTEADWDAGKTDVDTSPEGKSTMCTMRLVREWAAIRCGSGISLVTQQLELGKAGTDYVVGTASGATTFIRLRPGVAGFAKLASSSEKSAYFSYSWAESEPAPRYLLLSEKDRHREVLTRADTKAAEAPPAVSAPLAARPKLGDWSSATRLTGGGSAPSDCALLALNDWLRIDCKKPLSPDSFDQYSLTPLEGLGEKGKDHYAQATGLVGNELVVELRMAKGVQKAKITTSPITGNHHVLTVEWPEGADRPKRVVLEGGRR